MNTKNILVPDIGDFQKVLIVDIFVKPGDHVELDTPLASVESDKATMDIPSPVAGTIIALAVGLGEEVSEGSLLAQIDVGSAVKTASETAFVSVDPVAPAHIQQNSPAASADTSGEVHDLLVIGGGPGGYSAAFRAADLGLSVCLIERDPTLGGVCLNVGCIPSKALLHIASVKEEAERLSCHGISFSAPGVDIDRLRAFKSSVVAKLTDGLSFMAKGRKVEVIRGTATFADSHHLNITLQDGGRKTLAFRTCIIAAGSSAVHLPFLPNDPRIVDSTGALDLPFVPKNMLIVGGGIIGLEMATVYSALGARIDIVEQFDGLLNGIDRDLVKIWMSRNKHRFDRVMTSTNLTSVTATKEGLSTEFEGPGAAPKSYDLILQATGRRPNGSELNLEAAGLRYHNGFISVNDQMQTAVSNIFAIGDLVGQPMLAHKAVHQGHVAAEVASGHKASFDTKVIPSVAYTDPEIAWAGLTETDAKSKKIPIKVARFPWSASGRAIANGAEYGVTKLLFSAETGRLLGGAIVGPSAGDMLGEICLAVEMGADAADIGKTIHPHPTLGESIGMAAEISLGICTDMP
jgi:dihydrolipoamide dehydrogenase